MGASRANVPLGLDIELDAVAAELGLSLAPEVRARLIAHAARLSQWNQRVNLTRIEDGRDVARRHFGESLFLWNQVQPVPGMRVADIGSGAGFPGLPVAAASPETRVCCVEPAGKKAVFLREVSRDWGNVSVCQERAECFRRECDWTVMRAVAAAPILGDLARIAPRAALLCGERTICEVRDSEWFDWDDPRLLPWGERRFLLIGRRST